MDITACDPPTYGLARFDPVTTVRARVFNPGVVVDVEIVALRVHCSVHHAPGYRLLYTRVRSQSVSIGTVGLPSRRKRLISIPAHATKCIPGP